MRLDKFLCDQGIGSRTDVKKYIKQGKVTVNNEIVKDSAIQIDPDSSVISFMGKELIYEKELYYLFHKPAGCVTANTDSIHKTVLDYFPENERKRLNAAGRLDLDTEGLLILTSDGAFLHHLISPKHSVEKTYFAKLDHEVPESAIKAFESGIDIGDDKVTLPAKLIILPVSEENGYTAELTIQEGRFHQVKRMFHEVGCEVIYLKRIKEGNLSLGDLKPGEYRSLTKKEIADL